ncbi:hypothetical protein NDU88_007489 [Pleurodeles waltl]|uniref:Uncharacterized protein n=1 Tax=Pleurodeles waltl TaxID=8319 RepID=A0AAV7PTS9_PLEWA|nr:hypothetical protein NDU88_007489 [Pleurodeles waltl]
MLSLPRGGRHFVSLRQFNIGFWDSSKDGRSASDSRLFGAPEAPSNSLVCFGRLRGPGHQDYCALVVAAGSSALRGLLHRPLATPPRRVTLMT